MWVVTDPPVSTEHRMPRLDRRMRWRRDCPRWAATSSSSPPTSSATTRSAATAAPSPARPVVDGLAARASTTARAYNQNTVCMPARCTMLTGQYAAHPRRRRQRCAAARGRAERRRVPARRRRLPHRARRQGALRARVRLRRASGRRTSAGVRGDTGPWRGFDYSIQAAHVAAFQGRPIAALRALARGAPPRAPRVASAPLLGATPGRRHRRAGDEAQPDPARVVPHRLDRRSRDRLARHRSAPTTTSSAG